MSELEIIATFDTSQTARSGAKLLNSWFRWVMEGSDEDTEDLETIFDDFGLSLDDFPLDKDTDTDWVDTPEANIEGNKIIIGLDSNTGLDTVRELLEAMGAYDVSVGGEDE
jgi:hypothetical protein